MRHNVFAAPNYYCYLLYGYPHMSDTNSVEATELDISNWNRREHFHFFKSFSEPYFGLTVNVNCTALVQHCQNTKESFYLRYLHSILATVNQLEPLKLRFTTNGERVLKYQRIHASVIRA